MVDLAVETPMRASEVCAVYKISRRTLDEWHADGLDMVRMGKKLLYTTREELQRFARSMHPATSQPVQSQSELNAADRDREEVRKRFGL